MLLQNEKAPNMKLVIGKETLVTDAEGKVEVEGKDVIAALLVSGFSAVKGKKQKPAPAPAATKPAPAAPEKDEEEESEEEEEVEEEEEAEEEKPKTRIFRRQ